MARKKTTQSVVLTARQLLNGYTTDVDRRFMWNTAPYQMLPIKEKDDEWRMWNMDWYEHIGLRQIMREGKRLQRNYNLANGIIDKADYLIVDDNEFADMIGMITTETNSPFSLRFYPIIPNVVNVLQGEFAKRDKRIIVKATDEYAENEALDYKMNMITQILTANAQQQHIEQMLAQGIDIATPESQEQLNTIAQLQEAETKYKSYRGIGEQWGQHTLNSFEEEHRMYEKEIEGFRDSLVADREFWHVDVQDDNMRVSLWNPLYTFYHKSPDVQYISEGNYAGYITLMSIPDVIDMYGRKMNKEQLDALKNAQSITVRHGNVVDDARKHDATQYWDASQPYDKQQPNSIYYEQYQGLRNEYDDMTNFSWSGLARLHNTSVQDEGMIRVTRAYWKSQRRVGHLTRIMEDGTLTQEIVDEQYQVTFPPVYDKSIVRNETKNNLAYGEHIDWIWINEVWGGVKIGANNTTYYQSKGFGFDPIYLEVKPLRFQFKGQDSLYGGKLPVEGKIFSERNSKSSPLVDRMSSFQIGFNIVNNQVNDYLADEIGKVFLIDQNMIPRNSLEGSWGKYNFPKFYQVMKDHQIAPIDTTMDDTGPKSFNQFTAIDLSKTDQIMSRLELAQYFKNQAFEVVGVTPQRLGEITPSESATGVQQAVNNSYSQTEMYFEQHINFLMPRVYQMMLEAAQYISVEYPESRVAYMNRKEETEWFRIEGWRLLLTDYKIYAQSKANVRATMEKLTNLAIQNNTAGGSLYELSKMITSDSPSEIISRLKEFDDNRQKEVEAQRAHELKLQQDQQEFLIAQREKELQNENHWKEREIQKDILVASMKESAGPVDTSALDQANLAMEMNQHTQDNLLEQQALSGEMAMEDKRLQVEREKIAAEKYKADITLKVAKENKPARPPAKKKK